MTRREDPAEDTPLVYTVTEAAAILRVGPRAIREAVRTEQLRSVRLGRVIRIPRAAIQELLGELEAAPNEQPDEPAQRPRLVRPDEGAARGSPG